MPTYVLCVWKDTRVGVYGMVSQACLELGPLHTRDWEPVTITLQALSLVEKAEAGPSTLPSTLEGPTEYQDGCTIYMKSYVASNGSCFMITWTIFKNHLLEVGLTQNRETTALWKLTAVGLFYFTMCEDPCKQIFIGTIFGWGPSHIWLHTILEDLRPDYMILEVCWDGLWTLSFVLSQGHGHGSWLMCEVALSIGATSHTKLWAHDY